MVWPNHSLFLFRWGSLESITQHCHSVKESRSVCWRPSPSHINVNLRQRECTLRVKSLMAVMGEMITTIRIDRDLQIEGQQPNAYSEFYTV